MWLRILLHTIIFFTLSSFAGPIYGQTLELKVDFRMKDKEFVGGSYSLEVLGRNNNELIGRFDSRDGVISLPKADLDHEAYDVVIFSDKLRIFLDEVEIGLFQNKWLVEIWSTSRVKRRDVSYVRASEYRVTFFPRNKEAVKTYYHLKK